ncbi:DUF4054 domain-containing protein [Agarivorans sp. JK6]|uniref:DUF4054 domain-containing protein n=1 Tax=Agarivorans sp. JK6 TaxID=2997426 RepID=UPI003872ECD8
MALITVADIKARFPEFNEVTDPRVQVFIDDAELQLGACPTDENKRKLLVAYMVAHLLKRSNDAIKTKGAAPSGALSSRSVGDVSVSFQSDAAPSSNAAAYWAKSSYGQEYWRLLRKFCGAPVYVV